jgi:hypothetical protein
MLGDIIADSRATSPGIRSWAGSLPSLRPALSRLGALRRQISRRRKPTLMLGSRLGGRVRQRPPQSPASTPWARAVGAALVPSRAEAALEAEVAVPLCPPSPVTTGRGASAPERVHTTIARDADPTERRHLKLPTVSPLTCARPGVWKTGKRCGPRWSSVQCQAERIASLLAVSICWLKRLRYRLSSASCVASEELHSASVASTTR